MDKREFDKFIGMQLCSEGVPHNPDWNEDITQGYNVQYQHEQNMTNLDIRREKREAIRNRR